ncbi:MAG: acyl-ACP--UDP-N-acetylglucosamine O-acyltransferase [Planctomycetota bacterium]
MPTIHPTAIVDPAASLADDVQVGPFCIVGPKVTLGAGCRLMSHIHIMGRTTAGEHNTFWPQCVIGAQPQDLKYQGEDTELLIGDHNDIRESVTMHPGTANDLGVTRVGSHNLIMAYAHVAHDCVLGDRIVIANGVQLAGHVCVKNHAVIGGVTAIHHMVTIGQHAFVGGMVRVSKDVPPFMVVEGNPARVRNLNTIGLKRRGFTDESIAHLRDAYRRLYGPMMRNKVVDTEAVCADLTDAYPHDPHVATLVQALRDTAAGLHGRSRENTRKDNRWSNPSK